MSRRSKDKRPRPEQRLYRQTLIDPRLRRLLKAASDLVCDAAPDDERMLPLRRALDPFTGALERPADVRTTLSDLGRERGVTAEVRVLRLIAGKLRDEQAPRWLKSVRAATAAEDARGWDLVLSTTDAGDLGVQVKASVSRANAARTRDGRSDVIHNTVFMGAPTSKPEGALWGSFLSSASFVYSNVRRYQLRLTPVSARGGAS